MNAVHQTEAMLSTTLLQLVVIVGAARVAGAIALRNAQSRAVGEIIVGVMLGPSLLGLLMPGAYDFLFKSAPQAPMTILSQIGLILLMFQIGLEFDFSHLRAREHRRSTLSVAAAGLVLPFALGLAFGYFTAPVLSPSADPLVSALFIATAFSITALPILGRIMIEFNMTRVPIGVIAISAAAINDVVGWLLLALVTALAVSGFRIGDYALKLGLLTLYVLVCWQLVRPLLHRLIRRVDVQHKGLGGDLLALLLSAIFLSGIATFRIGIFAIFGGFMLGVLLHDAPGLLAAWKARVGAIVEVLFLPIFFTFTGLRTDIGGLDSASAWGWCALLIALATAGKFAGCYGAARWSGLDHYSAKIIGLMMNTRALMELIVINIGYDLGVISQNVFTMLVLMALFSTVLTTPGLRSWLPRIGLPIAGYRSEGE